MAEQADVGKGIPDPDDKVGYCCPPKRSRFQPGQSGNPKGRPAGRLSLRKQFERVTLERIPVGDGKKAPAVVAAYRTLGKKSVDGDTRAALGLLNFSHKTGLFDRDEESGHQESRSATDLMLAGTDPKRLSGDESDEMVKLCRFMDENAPGSLRPERQARLMELIFKATPPCNAGAADGGDAAATEDDADDSESVEMFSMPPPGAAPSEGARV
jgi:Family of unknown function (DUF5681)